MTFDSLIFILPSVLAGLIVLFLGYSEIKKRKSSKPKPKPKTPKQAAPKSAPIPTEPTPAQQELEEAEAQSKEDLAYRQNFAERYGIGSEVMNETGKKKDEWKPQTLDY